ncbi:MAG: redox-regulated ATPase YchF [Chloroflexi bacterium]|nr:redox-regulated ATPase YchF [Chloroflexota bacterium]
MPLHLTITGLPNSGKTTVFNALTRSAARTGGFAAAGEVNLATVKVPDARLDRLAEIFHPKKIVPADVQYVDVAGLAKGMAEHGLGGQLLGHLAQADALVHVVRAFIDASVPHPEETVDPLRDIETLNLELLFSDLSIIEKRRARLQASIPKLRGQERDAYEREAEVLARLQVALEAGTPLRQIELAADETKSLRGFGFLTAKPILILLNLGEDQLGADGAALLATVRERFAAPQVEIEALAGRIEMEIGQLEPADAAVFLADLGIVESSLDRVIHLSYALLGLISFLTAGPDECRAWTIARGTGAQEAAGVIHTDLARGFIRAQVVRYDDLIACGSLAEARHRGLLRQEGKTYVVQDGDVIEILFNV